jgi:ribose transport system permease protein
MGLAVGRTKVGVYVISGTCSALAGLLFTFYMLSGYSLHAVGMELDAIAAVVLGGTSLAGGRGRLYGTLVGSVILGVLSTGLILLNVQFFTQLLIKGGVIILAVTIDGLKQRPLRRQRTASSGAPA